jgi:hypothetical protein
LERNDNRMTWLIIIGLIVVGALASAVWPVIAGQLDIGRSGELAAAREAPEPIVIDIEDYLLGPEIMGLLDSAPEGVRDFVNNNINGREVPQFLAIGILTALTIGALVMLAAPLALIYTRLEKSAAVVQEDENYKLAVSALEKRQNAELKEQRQAKPARVTADAAEDRRGFAYTMAFLGIVFAWVIGAVIGHAAYGGEEIQAGGQLINPVSIVSLFVLILALVAYYFYFRFVRKPEEIDPAQSDYSPVSWGWVWVIVSGLIIVGLGTGLALNLIASGSAPPG